MPNNVPKKHGALDLRQSQISQTEIGSSTSSMSTFKFNQQRNKEGFTKFVASMSLPFTFGEDPRFLNYIQDCVQPTLQRVPMNTCRGNIIRNYKDYKQLII